MVIRPYILAGGRSSRMGKDKAKLLLAGASLLRRAVETLRAVSALQDSSGQVMVTIVGERPDLAGADRVIVDRYPACGPLGGMEAALGDLHRGAEAEWAFFMPVDMPFLSAKVIAGLLLEWDAASAEGARLCHVTADGKPQPLVSLIHRSAHPFILEALTAGRYRVTPVLQSAGELLASTDANSLRSVLHVTDANRYAMASASAGWNATGEPEDVKRLWFLNVNTPKEFLEAETLLRSLGSIYDCDRYFLDEERSNI